MSKMGISTYQSYCGAQIFDAVGLSRAFVDEFFFGTATTIEGVGLAEIAEETARRHARRLRRLRRSYAPRSKSAANTPTACAARRIAGRRETVSLLQHAVRGNASAKYDAYREAAQRTGRAIC